MFRAHGSYMYAYAFFTRDHTHAADLSACRLTRVADPRRLQRLVAKRPSHHRSGHRNLKAKQAGPVDGEAALFRTSFNLQSRFPVAYEPQSEGSRLREPGLQIR